jgi:hypothetical protein
MPDGGVDGGAGPAGGVDGLIDQVARFWKVSMRSSRDLLAGTYSFGDAAQDLQDLISSSAAYAVRVADDLWGPDPPLTAYDGTWEATMYVREPVTGQVALSTSGLTAVGAPDVRIPPENVTIEPRVLGPADTTFKVTVAMAPEHRRRTLIFEGEIEAEGLGAAVTDTVWANNRDDGPVT